MKRNLRADCRCEDGISLVATLLMLIAVLVLGTSAANIALQSEKASRNDRDRQIAFQAAEAALVDAELDIEASPDTARTRSKLFEKGSATGFSAGCSQGLDKPAYQGLCLPNDGGAPVWQTIDFTDDSANARSVAYGRFTGMNFQTGKGPLPAKPPRYIVELLTYNKEGESAGLGETTHVYRITAAGFGMMSDTVVVLQTYYRKEG